MTLIFSSIADPGWERTITGWVSIRLWLYIRSLETDGSGIATVSIEQICKDLKIDQATLRRYRRDGLALGFFRFITKKGDYLEIGYCALHKIMARHNIEELGAIFEASPKDMAKWPRLKMRCRQAVMQRCQQRSFHNATHAYNASRARFAEAHAAFIQSIEGLGYKAAIARNEAVEPTFVSKEIKSARTILKTPSDKNGGSTCLGRRIGRFLFVESDVLLYGANQETIACEMGYSVSTVRRVASDSARRKVGLAPLRKVQAIAPIKSHKPNEHFDGLVAWNLKQSLGFDNGAHVFSALGKLWRTATNIYAENMTLLSKRTMRGRIKKLLNRTAQSG